MARKLSAILAAVPDKLWRRLGIKLADVLANGAYTYGDALQVAAPL